jgi:hypothetical protein
LRRFLRFLRAGERYRDFSPTEKLGLLVGSLISCADNPSATQNTKARNSGVKWMIPSSEKLLNFAPLAVFLASNQ